MADQAPSFSDFMKDRQTPQPESFGQFMGGQPGQIGPTLPQGPPGSHPTQQQTDVAMQDFGRMALKYAPGIFATAAAITQPEFWPAVGYAALGAGAGSGVKQAGQIILNDPDQPKNVQNALGTTAWDMVENASGEGLSRLAAKPIEWAGDRIAHSLYQSALRPGGAGMTPETAEKLVETGLRERIPIGRSGYKKLAAKTDALDQQIEKIIQSKTDELGAVLDPRSVAKRVDQLRPTAAGEMQVNPAADVSALDKAQSEFLDKFTKEAPYTKIAPGVEEPGYTAIGQGKNTYVEDIPALEAQRIKQGTYKQLSKNYDKFSPSQIEAQKALARGLKEDLEKLFPQLSQINPRYGEMIELEHEIRKHVLREGNKSLFGFGHTAAATAGLGVGLAGHAESGAAIAALTLMHSALQNPAIRSRLAIALRMASTTGSRAMKSGAPIVIRGVSPWLSDDTQQQRARGGTIIDRQPSRRQMLEQLKQPPMKRQAGGPVPKVAVAPEFDPANDMIPGDRLHPNQVAQISALLDGGGLG